MSTYFVLFQKKTNKKSSAVFFYFSNTANDFQHSHTVSSAAERKEMGRQCLLIMCAIEFVCFTEKSRRSNAREQAQQCSHGIETAGAKQGRCFEPLEYLLLLLVLSTFTRSILNKKTIYASQCKLTSLLG